MNTYIINLLRSTERRKEMQRQLKKLGLPYIFVEAVDAASIPDEVFHEIAPSPNMRKGEVACVLSHISAYREFLQSGDNYALIMEDDCIINEDLPSLMDDIENYIKPDHITLLTYYWCREGVLRLKVHDRKGGYSFSSPHELWGVARAGAYIVSRKIAQNILDFHRTLVKCTADNWLVYQREGIISGVHCIYPQPVQENPTFGSDIDYVQRRAAKLLKSVMKKIPVLDKIAAKRRQLIANSFKNIEVYET